MSPPSKPVAVVDTDVLSMVFKRDSRAALYQPYLESHYIIVSFMTVAELRRWTVERNWGSHRKEALEAYLGAFTVYHSDDLLCRWRAAATAAARQKGRRIQVADAWIAATALLYHVPLITTNAADYAAISNLQLITAGSS